jgi:hypothetical protein
MSNFGGSLGQPKKMKLILEISFWWWIFDFETDYKVGYFELRD